VRSYIFTERERRLLERWIRDDGEENQQTRIVLSRVRRNWFTLADDMVLLFEVVRTMMRRRWRGRVTRGSGFGAVLRGAESSLSRGGRRG